MRLVRYFECNVKYDTIFPKQFLRFNFRGLIMFKDTYVFLCIFFWVAYFHIVIRTDTNHPSQNILIL